MSTELSIYEKISDPIQAVTQLGEMFTRSGMFGCQKIEQGQVLALACLTEKKSPFELVQTYHIIEGKLEMKSSAMLAKFLDMGGKCTWKTDLQDDQTAEAHFEFLDNKGDYKYTLEDAKREGLADRKVWKRHGPDMLRARLTSKVIRMLAPQINAGMYAPEEMEHDVVEKELNLKPVTTNLTIDLTESPEPIVEEVQEASVAEKAKEIIKEIGEERVLGFLKARGKISSEGTIDDISEEYQQNIVSMPEVFERSIVTAEKKGDE